MLITFLCYLTYVLILLCSQPAYLTVPFSLPEIYLTISAKSRSLEVSWENARLMPGDIILITTYEPKSFQRLSEPLTAKKGIWSTIVDRKKKLLNDFTKAIGVGQFFDDTASIAESYMCNNGTGNILAAVIPKEISQWLKTPIEYDAGLSNVIDISTKCYGYWASYIDENGNILATGCIRAYPTWMNDIKDVIGKYRIRDLFIPGTHNSGSYKPGFHPKKHLDIFTRFTLTQDDDIWEQLMHGIRYLDLRIGYYEKKKEKFYTNHDISRQRPLKEVLEQIRDFVRLTNEIVIVDIQEFPVGFNRNITIHRELIELIQTYLEDYIIDPAFTWGAYLNEVWESHHNIFLSYDYMPVLDKYPNLLFPACHHRWADARDWETLEKFLKSKSTEDIGRYFRQPQVDMAELTADLLGILSTKFTGLRKMADSINSKVTKLYQDEIGQTANIVAVDFYRGTRIVDLSIEWNSKKS